MRLEPRGGGPATEGDSQEAGPSGGGYSLSGGLRYESVWAMPPAMREQVVSQVVAKDTKNRRKYE